MAVHLAFVEALWALSIGVFGVALVACFVYRRLADRGVSAHIWLYFGEQRRMKRDL